ncbi:protein kinase domain-containing protein [Polyangium spumosum]|uniref:Protein kinase n=1 Tax=Polyangium spumosum TaxID=889282 RepID=A0A6N7PM90_9BACT|nr:serine/threonine-protein kinase [Polyangium spumosum]MRG93193.1 protein kinase [Polyangium spumosum]
MAEGTLAQPGDVIARRYRVESWLGQGNMAIVYQAKHVNTGKACALKLVHPHLVQRKEFVDLFVKEAQLGARIGENPHIVDVFDAGVDEARKVPYLAMELLQGDTLESYLKKHGRLPPRLAHTIFEHLADALDQAHGAGVIHRDLKPGNLFLARDRKGQILLKVMDFGIAKVLESHEQRTATQIGSPAYAAPEQLGATLRSLAATQGISISQTVQASTDVWALGLVAYEALTGVQPGQYWGVDTYADLMICIALEDHPAASHRAGDYAKYLPYGFDKWFTRCIQRDATARWQSAGEAVRELMRLLDAHASDPITGELKLAAFDEPAPSKAARSVKPLPKPMPKPAAAGPLRPSVTGLPLKLQAAKATPSPAAAAPAAAPRPTTTPTPTTAAPKPTTTPIPAAKPATTPATPQKPTTTPTPPPAVAAATPAPAPAAAPASPTLLDSHLVSLIDSAPSLTDSAAVLTDSTPSLTDSAPKLTDSAPAQSDAMSQRPTRPMPPPKPQAAQAAPPPLRKAAPPPVPVRREPPPKAGAPPMPPKERARLQELAMQLELDSKWSELCDVLRKLEAAEPTSERKARYLYQLAIVLLDRLEQTDRALELLDEALDKNPSLIEAFDHIVAIHEGRADWKKIERAYRKMLHRHAGTEDTALKHRLWFKLGEIYRDLFENAGAAVEAFRMALRSASREELIPDHLTLADLCANIGQLDDALASYQAVVRADPQHVDAYRAIYRLSVDRGAYDPAWCAAAALAFLREADEEQVGYFQDYRPEGRIQVKSRFDNELWARHVFHEDQSLLVGKVFEMMARAAMKAKVEALRQRKELLALDPFLRQDPTTSSVPFVRTMGWASRVIGVTCPALFVRSDVPGGIVAVPTEPPASVVGQSLLGGFSQEELAFIAGKHLAMYRGEHYIKLLFPSAEELRVIFHAAVKMVMPDANTPRDVDSRAETTAKVLRSFMGPREQDGLRAVVRKFISEREEADIGRYFRAVEYTATRAGFILCGDLGVAKKIIAAEPTLSDDPLPSDKMKDLLAYSVSESYLVVREALGIAVGQE